MQVRASYRLGECAPKATVIDSTRSASATTQGDELDRSLAYRSPNDRCGAVAVQPRHVDIHEDKARLQRRLCQDGLCAVVDRDCAEAGRVNRSTSTSAASRSTSTRAH